MKFAVLTTAESWYFRDLARAAGNRHRLTPLPFTQIACRLTDAGRQLFVREVNLHDFDAILVRTMPPGSLEQVVFRMDALGQFADGGGVVLNPPRAMEIAVDKFLASAKLQAAGLATPRTVVCQDVETALAAFDELGQDIVLKPLFGSEGRGLTRINDEAIFYRSVKMLAGLGAVLYLQEFVRHEGCDLRLLVLGEKVLGIRRCHPTDWRTNISRGATAAPLEVTSELAEIALAAAAAVGAPLAGVDLLPAQDGRLLVLEVNAVPGWKGLAAALNVDVARMMLETLQAAAK